MNNFVNYLEKRLKQNLPGINSHLKMTPKIMERSFRNLEPNPNAKQSAVLILLSGSDNPEILFTLRSSNLRSHKGQISFPGGRIEKDELPQIAALRETMEEVGIEPENVKIIGKLSNLFVPPSNNLIHPFVGILKNKAELNLSELEVEECFWLNFQFFLDKSNLHSKKEILEGYEVDMPYWEVNKKSKLWGATSMILQELLDLHTEWVVN